jgi:hypothetical protein
MSAKKLGRFAAGLFVALGLAFGGALAAGAGASSAAVAANTSSVSVTAQQSEYEWG